MNKKLLFIGGALFAVLLGIFATLQLSYDQSSFQGMSSSSEPMLEKVGGSQQYLDITPAISINSGAGAAVTPSVANLKLDRLNLSIAQSWVNMIDATVPRLQAFVVLDRQVYRKGDPVFGEVFLFNAITKTPYVPTADYDIAIRVNNLDTGAQAKKLKDVPSLGFFYRIPTDYAGTTIKFYASGANFVTAVGASQVRDSAPVATSLTKTIQIDVFNDAAIGQPVYGKISYLATRNFQMTISGTQGSLSDSFDDFGNYYFQFTAPSAEFATITVTVPDIANDAAVPDEVNTFTFPIQAVSQVALPQYMDPKNYNIRFNNYAHSDLVLNVTQMIYFYSYWAQESLAPFYQQAFYDFTNGAVKSYNVNDPTKITTVIATLATSVNGFGSFAITPAPNTVYFVEVKLNGFDNALGNDLGQTVPLVSPVVLPKGVVRIPVTVNSISNNQYLKTLQKLKAQNIDNSDVLKLFKFEKVTAKSADISNLKYSYVDGLFSVYEGTSDTPLIVFNQVPYPKNFAKKVLFNWQYVTATNNGMETTTISRKSYNLQKVTQDLLDKLVDLLTQFFGNTYATSKGFPTNDAEANFKVLASDIFPYYVQGKPYAQVTVFGADGPIQSKIEGSNGLSKLNTQAATNSDAEATFTLAKRILTNTEALTVNIGANSNVKSDQVYYLAIKNKEKTISHQALVLKAGTTSVTIPATDMALPNGGFLTANLYQVDKDYFDFQTDAGTEPYCALYDIEAATLATEDKDLLEDIEEEATDKLALTEVFDKIYFKEVKTAGNAKIKKCIVLSPAVVRRFLKQIGSAQFYKKPAVNVKIDLTPNNVVYQQGQEATVIVKVSNMATNVAIANSYLSLSVVEDQVYSDLQNYPSSLTTQLFTENDISVNSLPLDPRSYIDSIFTQTTVNSINERNLDLILATQAVRASAFEISTLDLYPFNTDDEDYLLPNSLEDIGMFFGGKFSALANPKMFTQSAIQNYYAVQNFNQQFTFLTGINLQGSSLPYIRTEKTVVDGTSAVVADTNFGTTAFANALADDYKTSDNKVLPEVLYFRSSFKSATGTETIKFKVGDLKTNYRIKATVVTANGIGISSRTISVADAFSFTTDMPKVMMEGEKYTVTVNVINFASLDITAVPSLTIPSSDDYSITSVFTYQYKPATPANAQATAKEDYIVTKNTTTYSNVFTVQVNKAIAGSTINLNFKLVGTTSDTKNVFTRTMSYPVTFLQYKPQRYNASADELGTRQQINPSFTNTSDFYFKAPEVQAEADKMQFVVNIIDSYQSRLTMMINDLLQESYDQQYLNSEEITLRIEMVLSKYVEYTNQQQGLDTNSVQYKAYEQRKQELVKRAFNYYKKLNTDFLVKNSDGVAQGYGYYKNQAYGNITVTAYIIKVVSRYDKLSDYKNANSPYQQNAAWLLSRRDNKGGYTHPVAVDPAITATQKVVNAFITDALQYVLSPTGQSLAITTEINSVLSTAKASFKQGETADTVTSDPYYLALSIQCLTGATGIQKTDIQPLVDQMLKHFLSSSGQYKMAKLNDTYTIFNAVGIDRVVEISALATLALQSFSNQYSVTTYSSQIMRALAFIRRQAKGPAFGSIQATSVAYQALKLTGRFIPAASNAKLTITTNNMAATNPVSNTLTTLTIKDFKQQPLSYVFTGAQFNSMRKNDFNKITFKITEAVTNVDNADFAFSYTIETFNTQTGFGGWPQNPSILALAVTPSFTATKLGAQKVNDNVYYTITVTNNEKTRPLHNVVVTLRPSPCLAIDTAKLDALVKSGQIADYIVRPESHEVDVFVRQIYGAQAYKIVANFTQKYIGTCYSFRPFSARYENAGQSELNVLPEPIPAPAA